jgi:hypothetical protein
MHKTPDEIREFDERQTEIRFEAEAYHRAHAGRVQRGCPICFESFIDDLLGDGYAEADA